LQDGINQLAAAGAQSQAQLQTVANQIARSLFTSTYYETLPPARTDVQYVTDLYYAYLQRGPDDSGLGFWTGQAAGSRVNVCNAFEVSGEFQTLVANLYGTAASDNERTEHFVNNFYLGAYGRNATPTELQQQRDALNAAAQNQAAVQAQAETFGRSLFAAQVNDASISNTQFVTNLYEAFLQRGPDTVGLGNWSGQASVGSGRQNVLNAFATFPAFRELSGTLYREANWLVTDHLSTPRMIVNKSGALSSVKRHDYLPFGEELSAGIGGRTTIQGYTGDSVRQRYTSYERDNETNLDYAQARYYSSVQGRFTGVDPLMASAKPTQPESWNRYAYCLNNPLVFTDPTGLKWAYQVNGSIRSFQYYEGETIPTGDGWEGEWTEYTSPLFDGGGSGPSSRVWLGEGGSYAYLTEDQYDEYAVRLAETGKTGPLLTWYEVGLLGSILSGGEPKRAPMGPFPATEVGAAEEAPLFSQTTASAVFQEGGPFAGKAIGEVAAGLRSGAINPSQLPLDVIIRNGEVLSLNTRSLLALRRAGIDPSQFVLRDVTGNAAAEKALADRLLQNGLTGGTDVLKVRGAGPGASSTH